VDRIAARGALSAPAAIGQAVADLMTTDLRRRLAKVRAPALILAAASGGDPDRVRSVYRTQYARLGRSSLHLATRARHFIMLDDPSFFFAELDAFFDQVAS